MKLFTKKRDEQPKFDWLRAYEESRRLVFEAQQQMDAEAAEKRRERRKEAALQPSPKSGKLGRAQAKSLAREYVKLHNDTSRKYAELFKKVGAGRWHDDDTHPLKAAHELAIARSFQNFGNKWHTLLKVSRPLTVLDSYPAIKKDAHKVAWLDKQVDSVWNEHKRNIAALTSRYKRMSR